MIRRNTPERAIVCVVFIDNGIVVEVAALTKAIRFVGILFLDWGRLTGLLAARCTAWWRI